MSKKSAKQLVMTPLYRQRVVKAKKGKGSYCRKQKPRTEFRGFCFQDSRAPAGFAVGLPGNLYGTPTYPCQP
ncbi:MAG: alternative ribosome rescue factor ArfA [Candidatus Competibacteraceae bacterium]